MVQRLLRAFAGALLLALIPAAWAAPALAARIDGAPLYAFSVEAMWQLARDHDPKATLQATRAQVIENRLLAGAARARFGEAQLSSAQRVAFAREVAFDDQLTGALRALYGREIDAALRKLPGGGIDALVRPAPPPDGASLNAVFGAPGRLLLDYTLTPLQQDAARKVVLLRYALPRAAGETITLYDVYRRQNVQGRVALFDRNPNFMLQQAKLQVGSAYVLAWSRQRFGAAAVADLRAALADQADAQVLLRMHGMGDDAHGGSVLLDELAQQVGDAEVQQFYRRNRQQFMRVERVRARHIRLPDEASAQKVAAQLGAGADFATLARRHSIAPDAQAGGALGWIRHEGPASWLAQLLFAQPQGKVSAPVRTPAGPGDHAAWEIVLVEQRVQGYQDPASESVRYAARRAIARATALQQLADLRRELLRKARIDIGSAS